MKRSSKRMQVGVVGACALVLMLGGGVPVILAEDPAPPEGDDPPGEEEPVPAPEPDAPTVKKKMPFGLYVAVGSGRGSVDDLNMSINATEQRRSEATMSFDRELFASATVGWRLPEDKGDFRMVFRGYKEEEYDFQAIGKLLSVPGGSVNSNCAAGAGIGIAPCLIPWWTVSATNGRLHSERAVPVWVDQLDDANGNGLAEVDEVRFLAPDRIVDLGVPDSLENQVQTIDLLYGREFGTRRFGSRWWTGLRYFQYKGNLLAASWLAPPADTAGGVGFTDGAFLRLLNFSQDTSGFGPTGSWEVDFNFFNKGVVLYARAQAALTFSSLGSDSGPFFTIVPDGGGTIAAPARLDESRDKSSWQNTIETGARVMLKNGLQFELAYSLTGFLDIVLLPSDITVPQSVNQSNDGVSALYATQDFVVSGWHANIGFQF